MEILIALLIGSFVGVALGLFGGVRWARRYPPNTEGEEL